MIEGRKISQFSQLAEVTFIETGDQAGKNGYWFSDRKYRRVFITEAQIYERLEKRQASLFPKT